MTDQEMYKMGTQGELAVQSKRRRGPSGVTRHGIHEATLKMDAVVHTGMGGSWLYTLD